jgi:hypothetical protein
MLPSKEMEVLSSSMVFFCSLQDNFHCWKPQTPDSGFVVAGVSYAPLSLLCQNHEDVVSSLQFYPAGVNFDEEAVGQNQQGRGDLVLPSVPLSPLSTNRIFGVL